MYESLLRFKSDTKNSQGIPKVFTKTTPTDKQHMSYMYLVVNQTEVSWYMFLITEPHHY